MQRLWIRRHPIDQKDSYTLRIAQLLHATRHRIPDADLEFLTYYQTLDFFLSNNQYSTVSALTK
jgi:hypothetical protein